MSAAFCYDNVIFEERVKGHSIQIVVMVNDKDTESARPVFDKSMSLPVFMIVAFVLLPLVFLCALVMYSIDWIASLFNRKEEKSYEEAKEYFKNGNGYLRSRLNDDDKGKLLSRRDGLPLGL